jgi:formamidopyrimidine-DNA glycosylase
MPELPEVERARREVQRGTAGRTIVKVATVADPIVYSGVPPARVASALRGRRIVAIRRKGKHLWMELDRRPWPAFHFGMTGSFHVYDDPTARPRFWKLEMQLSGGRFLAFRDVRRFARIRLQQDPPGEPPISRLGFDPLEGLPSASNLHAILRRRRAPLKALLLDQALFAGVGNWIADEVLYQARLSPHRLGVSLSLPEVRRVRSAVHSIIKTAVAASADSELFPKTWLFHDRWGRQRDARTYRGESIVHETVGGRTTAWIPGRQH